jgi:hypothetical protein
MMSGNCCYSVIQAVVYHPDGLNVKAFFGHVLAEYSDNHKEDVKDISVDFKVIQTNNEGQNLTPTENYTHRLEKVNTFIYTAPIDLDQQPE